MDDEEEIADIISLFLDDYFEVTLPGSPEEGLKMAAEKPFDLVITDMKMPGVTGNQILGQVQESFPRTPVIIMSGFDSNDKDVHEALSKGAIGYLPKPFSDQGELLNKIDDLLAFNKHH